MPFRFNAAAAGVTVSVVAAWATAIVAELTADSDPSEIVTANVYEPARGNVTVVALAALVPLAAKVGGAPAGPAVMAQA